MQTTVQNSMDIGLAGQIADLANSTVLAYANNSKKLDRVTVSADDTTTTVTINGTAFTFTETGAAENKAYIADALVTLINAGSEPVTVYYTALNEYFDIESNVAGTTTTVVGTASCVVTARIGNAAAIGFGLLVVQDEMDDDKASVPILTTDISTAGKALGVTIMTQAIEQNYQTAGGNGYALETAMSIMRKGRIYVTVEDAVTAGAQAFARFDNSGGGSLGAFRSDDDSSTAVALPTGYYRTNTAASGIAILEINLP